MLLRVPTLAKRIPSARNLHITKTCKMTSTGSLRLVGMQDKTKLKGQTPAELGSVDIQKQRCLNRLRSKHDDLNRYEYLGGLRQTNTALFYRLLMDHLEELTPLVYTPTIGTACLAWSHIYSHHADALYLTLNDKGNIKQVIQEFHKGHADVQIAVMTDGSRILGLGDLGTNGVGIPIGKLSLYVACAGIHPANTLPIVIDLGTNNEENLKDPLYLGIKQKRVEPAETRAFVSEVTQAFTECFPGAILQFEDFSNDVCFDILSENRDKYPCFNDDIQGTGAVSLAGFIRAVRLTGKPVKEHRFVFFGAGSAAVGIAQMLCTWAQQEGCSEEEARKLFWLVDSKGLVADNRGDKLQEHKKFFSRHEADAPKLTTLEDVIDHVRPTGLLGLSTVGGAFTTSILTKMGQISPRPIVFPLSNPITKSECTYEEALAATHGQVLFASGSPFPTTEYDGKTRRPQQSNNMYVFPGIGLGAILARVKTIPEELIHTSAQAVAAALNEEELANEDLFPDLTRIREVSGIIAFEIIRKAQKLNLDTNAELRSMSDEQLRSYVANSMYDPLSKQANGSKL